MNWMFWMIVMVVAIVVGLPIFLDFLQKINRDNIRSRELALEEKKLAMEERLKSDVLNAQILRMDDYGFSPAEFASLAQEVRQLREEVARLRQQMDNRLI